MILEFARNYIDNIVPLKYRYSQIVKRKLNIIHNYVNNYLFI